MTGHIRYTKLTANKILPDVVRRLHALRRATTEAAQHQEEAVDKAPTNGGADDPNAWASASNQAAQQLKWFSDAGILVKSLYEGLVDFPAEMDGKQILLCWKEGEHEVAFWHTLEDGYPGRRPL
ncbi:MAG: DUF2203 domain-containing protein [Actinomycetota bacterium]